MDPFLKKARQYYEAVAQKLGFTFQALPFGFLVTGTLEGVPVASRRYSESQCVTTAMLQPPAHLGLAVTPAGLMAKLGALFGAEDVRLGDKPFDDAFTVHGSDAAAISAVLTPEIRAALWELRRANLSFALTDVHMQITRYLPQGDGEDVEADLRLVARIARLVSQSVGQFHATHAPRA